VDDLVAKVVLAAAVIVGATWATRRWGEAVGGWIAGLPLTSGPVSLFLAMEQGPAFAARAAQSTLLALTGVAAFCVVYAASCGRSVLVAITTALGAFGITCWILSHVTSAFGTSLAITLAALTVATTATRAPRNPPELAEPPAWDLPCRVVVAVVLTIALTAAAARVGPDVSGTISPAPIVALVLATSARLRGGPDAARRVLHGVAVGSFGFSAFFVVVATFLTWAGVPLTYLCAIGAALVVQGSAFLRTEGAPRAPPRSRSPPRSPRRRGGSCPPRRGP
jgi:hypothetical protein